MLGAAGEGHLTTAVTHMCRVLRPAAAAPRSGAPLGIAALITLPSRLASDSTLQCRGHLAPALTRLAPPPPSPTTKQSMQRATKDGPVILHVRVDGSACCDEVDEVLTVLARRHADTAFATMALPARHEHRQWLQRVCGDLTQLPGMDGEEEGKGHGAGVQWGKARLPWGPPWAVAPALCLRRQVRECRPMSRRLHGAEAPSARVPAAVVCLMDAADEQGPVPPPFFVPTEEEELEGVESGLTRWVATVHRIEAVRRRGVAGGPGAAGDGEVSSGRRSQPGRKRGVTWKGPPEPDHLHVCCPGLVRVRGWRGGWGLAEQAGGKNSACEGKAAPAGGRTSPDVAPSHRASARDPRATRRESRTGRPHPARNVVGATRIST